jgi:hypothetical protein
MVRPCGDTEAAALGQENAGVPADRHAGEAVAPPTGRRRDFGDAATL